MKTTFVFFLTFIIMIPLFFSGCEEDDVPEVKKNAFVYNGKEYIITQGDFLNFGTTENFGDFAVALLNGLTFDTQIEEYTGKGDGIYLNFLSSSTTELVSGTYKITSSTAYSANTIVEAGLAIDFDTEQQTGATPEITEGTATVSVSGDTYEISFEGVTDAGLSVSCYYKGKLTNYNLVKKKVTLLD